MNLEINGKIYPLEWGMGSIEAYCDMLDCDISDLENNMSSPKMITRSIAVRTLTLCAIKNGCQCAKPKVEFDIDYNDLQLWLDRQPQEVAEAIMEDWKSSYYFGKTIAQALFGEITEDEIKNANKKKQVSAK